MRKLSRNCILLMRFISKWAAPDMFAYVLLYYLIRKLEHLPINTLCLFDIGFTCYSIFSLTCAMSSLGIPLPQVEDSEKDDAPPLTQRFLQKFWCGASEKKRLLSLTCTLAGVWACFFGIGMFVPCFGLRLDGNLLADHVPDSMKQVLKMIKLDRIIAPQHVSLWRSMWSMMYWFSTDRDLNLLIAFVMIAVFAVSLTILNMANLVKVAWQLSKDAPEGQHPCPSVAHSDVFKHLSMLDVLLMGVFVSTCAGGIYRDEGLIISIQYGIFENYRCPSGLFKCKFGRAPPP